MSSYHAENLPPRRRLVRVATAPRDLAMLSTSSACKWIAGFFVILFLSGLAIFWHQQTSPELRQLPLSERRTLYLRTLDTLRTSCAVGSHSSSVLADHCRHQATFILQFPECDARCRTLADPFLPKPSR
jgi:cytochrome b pre-mRNA-processing protein 3